MGVSPESRPQWSRGYSSRTLFAHQRHRSPVSPLAILDIRNPNELHCPVSVTGCANEALHYTEVHISLRGVS